MCTMLQTINLFQNSIIPYISNYNNKDIIDIPYNNTNDSNISVRITDIQYHCNNNIFISSVITH